MNKKKESEDSSCWADVDALAYGGVVQVFAQVSPFDWIQPYRIDSPFESRGTGFFVSDDGYFVTNAHVVNDARRIWVHIPALGKIPLPATVVGICPEIDVALARLHTDVLSFVKEKLGTISYFVCGDSDKIKPTEQVLVLGYPLGQNHVKSTTGVVSGREFLSDRPLLQMTAPVNPGNSGGPLVGVDGTVLGITVSGVLEAQAVGYAIPINEFKNVYEELMAGGLVRRPKLGLTLGFANDEKAAFLKNPEPAGLYVCNVIPGSLSDKAGVHEGDMLYELNGNTIDAYGESNGMSPFGRKGVADLIINLHIGQKVSMVLYRDGNRIDVSFTYDPHEPLPIRRRYAGYEPIDYEVLGGLVLMGLTDDHMELFADSVPTLLWYSLPKNRAEGAVIITYVFPGSYAHHMYSLLSGDIITYVNNIRVRDLDSFRKALHASIDTGLVAIKTEHDAFVVLSLEQLVRDEERLSLDFMYPISQTIVQLQQAIADRGAKKED